MSASLVTKPLVCKVCKNYVFRCKNQHPTVNEPEDKEQA